MYFFKAPKQIKDELYSFTRYNENWDGREQTIKDWQLLSAWEFE
jgi:hypothetical protein